MDRSPFAEVAHGGQLLVVELRNATASPGSSLTVPRVPAALAAGHGSATRGAHPDDRRVVARRSNRA